MSRAYGPRFNAGYQFPRTHAATLVRGEPVRRETPAPGARAEIVPLTGGRRRQFDVCGRWVDRQGVHCFSTAIATDELEARKLFVDLCATIVRETP